MSYDIIDGSSREEEMKFFTIGDLIDLGNKYPKTPFVFMGTKLSPSDLHSWRGSYCEPSIDFDEQVRIGEDIAQTLFTQLQCRHFGYKGGEYKYYKTDEFYVSPYGAANEYKVADYSYSDGKIILLTKIDKY